MKLKKLREKQFWTTQEVGSWETILAAIAPMSLLIAFSYLLSGEVWPCLIWLVNAVISAKGAFCK